SACPCNNSRCTPPPGRSRPAASHPRGASRVEDRPEPRLQPRPELPALRNRKWPCVHSCIGSPINFLDYAPPVGTANSSGGSLLRIIIAQHVAVVAGDAKDQPAPQRGG